ncbi:MAG: molecular chaperone DnaK [Candidatus Aminicenantes bacterium]|nr:molecular chaperone DnaK [Candidatus Aminicenantes bacterium]
MGQVIGLDLGTTQSCIAYLDATGPKIIPNLEGLPTTPSVVSFTDSGEKLVGNVALRQASTNPEKTIYAVKRLLGKKFDSPAIQKIQQRTPYKIAEAANGDTVVQIDSRVITPQEVSAMILVYLKKCAESYFGESVDEVIATVPAHFDDHQRQATKTSFQIAGMKVLRVINEPTAASLAYGLDTQKNATIAVYDLGGGTFDFTIMEINDGVFNVLASNGNTFLGGEDFNHRLIDTILRGFQEEYNLDISQDKLALQRIREASENAKRELSFKTETEINLPFIYSDRLGSKHITRSITRNQFEDLTKDLVDEPFQHIEQALNDCNLTVKNIDEIILAGGQSRMPLIKEKIANYFDKEPIEHISPEECVALGAAVQSGILVGGMKELVLLLDVTPLSLGIETENKSFVKIIEKNTTIPTSKTMAFTTVEDNQRRVKIHVLQGESEIVEENTSLAVFDLVGIRSAPAGIPQIDVMFEIDVDGIVKVTAKDVATDKVQHIEINPSSGLTQEEMESIIKRTHQNNFQIEAKKYD